MYEQYAGQQKRILMIEQDSINAELIRTVLEEEGDYDIRWARTPFEAFVTFGLAPGEYGHTVWPADLILFDIAAMDRLSIQALKQTIQAHCQWPPVIMLLDSPMERVEKALSGLNKTSALAKPFDIDELANSVRGVLQPQVSAVMQRERSQSQLASQH